MRSAWMIWRRAGTRVAGLAAIALGMALLAPCIRADDAGQGTRAARLSYVDGKVQVSQDNQILADPALANMPLFEATHVTTADDGRAEIQFEGGSVARLSPNSSLTLSILRGQGGSAETEVVLEGGLGYFELQAAGDSGQMRIRFGDSVVTASGFTVLRIDLDNLPGALAVFSGNAHLERGSALTLDLHGGQSVSLDGSDASRYNLSETITPDSWDAWNADRDQALQAENGDRTGATSNLADSNNPAWADLDANGNWYNVPGQGYVWSPYEASSQTWDPYGNGNWMWTPRFGYIWVSGDSWGYLPYQCGSWNFFNEFGWGWAPGGCHPWWGGGDWGYNIGYGPGGYHPPRRPHSGHPRQFDPHGTNAGFRPSPPHPIVPVSRRLSGLTGGFPERNKNTPVIIAGHPVRPVLPVASRPVSDGPSSGFGNRPAPIFAGGSRPTGGSGQPTGSGFRGTGPEQPSVPRSFGSSGPRPAPPSRPSRGGGGWFSHSSGSSGGGSNSGSQRPAAPSHPSRGGGGWFSHPSGSSGGGSRSGNAGGGSRGGGGGGGSRSGGGGGGGGSHGGGGGGSHSGGGGGGGSHGGGGGGSHGGGGHH